MLTRKAFGRCLSLVALMAGVAFEPARGQAIEPDEACAHIFVETGVPEIDADVSAATSAAPSRTFVCREGYALLHNDATHIPDWVAEDVTAEEVVGKAVRKNNFMPDPETPPPAGATLEDYRGSGFDRGHQAPAADFKNDQDRMDESFFLSNMAPQVGRCFNRGIWADLEDEVRDWAKTRKRLIVFTGPIYPDPIATIGDVVKKKAGVEVAVPESFYKIVFHPATKHSVAFLLPNEGLCSQDPNDFVTSIREIRELTGIDFFTSLTKRQKTMIERNKGNRWGW